MVGTRGRIGLLLWAAVTIHLMCDQVVAKDSEDSDEANTEDVDTAAIKKADIHSSHPGKPVESDDTATGVKAPRPGHKLIVVADPRDRTITQITTSDDRYFPFDRYELGYHPLLGRGIHKPTAVDYDKTGDFIFWTSVNGASSWVFRSPYAEGRGLRVDGRQASEPEGLAVDVISRNLYWTDAGTDRITVSRLDGSFRKSLITQGLDKPRAIVVDPNAGWMYWTDWGNPPKIERARMDGSERSVIVNFGQFRWPTGLALDASANRLYWCNGGTGEIWTSGVTGSNPRKIYTHTDRSLFGIAVDESYLYWTATNDPGIHRISKSLERSSYFKIRYSHFKSLHGIVVRTAANTPSQPNACSTSNGNCAQLCLPVPGGGRTCACQDGWTLESDGRSCISDDERTRCQGSCSWSNVTEASCVDGFCECLSENYHRYRCLPIQCPSLTAPANGVMDSAGANAYQDVVTFTCNSGYRLNGASSVTCQADETWSGPVPTCTVPCPTLTAPGNGALSPPGANSYQDVVTITCNQGYMRNGASDTTCQADGTWSNDVPTCTPIRCPSLTAPANGVMDSAGANYWQDRVTFSCNSGYRLNGASSVTCQADETWSGPVPTCAVLCPTLTAPGNGTLSPAGANSPNDVVTITCNRGYMRSGASYTMCQSDGTWSNAVPTCSRTNVAARCRLCMDVLFGALLTAMLTLVCR
ncbi:LRP6 [Branchiostoma lanceolatum]|uniref:LRP6 protein n=1 Tax=Branchiostoma lanceolatum TaxID=7740 RepID=A0A8J9ZPJ2_BRALA|nr:LRP6 [Branchiostoma lanceolatum]